jgi:transposase
VYGYDGNKRIKGRKRIIAVDTLGLLMAVRMAPANLSEQDCLKRIVYRIPLYPSWQRIVADGGFAGAHMEHYCQRLFGIELQIVKRSDVPGVPPLANRRKRVQPAVRPANAFVPQPCRWVVERTLAWIGRCRRFARDYELLAEVSEFLQILFSVRLITRRLAKHSE